MSISLIPALAVILSTRNRPDLLETALEALTSASRPQDEIVVVDSASSDPATMRIAASAGIRAIRLELPGLSRARNAGIQATTAGLLAFTDDDCIAQSDWTTQIARSFQDESVGFISGRVIPWMHGEALLRFSRGDDPANIGHGANMSFRRSALESVGCFDECLGAGAKFRAGEDRDAMWRVLNAGWQGLYDPRVVVRHPARKDLRPYKAGFGYGVGAGARTLKATRIERQLGRKLLFDTLWKRGWKSVASNLIHRRDKAWVASLAKATGATYGVVTAIARPVHDGHFVNPR